MSAASLLTRLAALDACAVSDALDALGLAPAVVGLSPLSVPMRIAGRAVTVKLGPEAPRGGSSRHLCTGAIETGGTGDVIVIEHSSGVEAAGWGGVLSFGAQQAGIAGVVIDGPVRDIDEARELEFPVYGRSPIARTARGRIYEQNYQCPILIGTATVAPGDLVLADSSGVVFLPQASAGEIIARAERIAQKERLMVEALRAGQPITEVLGRDYETMLDKAP
jgi:4-hydroxy-4-methyl-2-oxoglutarate aldolase